MQQLLPVWGKLDGLSHSVHDPAKDELPRSPTSVPFQELLQGNSFVPAFVWQRSRQHFIHAVQQLAAKVRQLLHVTLSRLDEIVDEHVSGSHGLLEHAVRVGCRACDFGLRAVGQACQGAQRRVGRPVLNVPGRHTGLRLDAILHSS